MLKGYTSIEVSEKTKKRLDRLKFSPSESYNDVLERILSLIPDLKEKLEEERRKKLVKKAEGGEK